MVSTIGTISTTKHGRMTEELRQRIAVGDLQPGDRLPSFSELRTEWGVTLSTVEKALTSLERDGLIERFHGKGVFVRQKAQSNKCLGFLNLKQGTPAWGLYWVQFMEGLQSGAHAAGYDILLINPALTSWHDKVDGVVLHEMTPRDDVPGHFKVPHVNVLSSVPGISCVVADEFSGGQAATQHLLDLGHRRIAYLVDDSHWETQMRLTGYRASLQAAGVNAEPGWVRTFHEQSDGQLWVQSGKTQMLNWLDNGWKETGCTALLCHNDEVAMGVLEALRERELRVPEDISLMGYDGTILCDTVRPRLTSIRVPLYEIGARAATMLIERLETGKHDAVTISLPTTLQLRGSTGCR